MGGTFQGYENEHSQSIRQLGERFTVERSDSFNGLVKRQIVIPNETYVLHMFNVLDV